MQVAEVGQRRQLQGTVRSDHDDDQGSDYAILIEVVGEAEEGNLEVLVVTGGFQHATVVANVGQRSDLRADRSFRQVVRVIAETLQVTGGRLKIDVHVAKAERVQAVGGHGPDVTRVDRRRAG